MDIGTRIRARRKRLNLTLEDVANRVGISRQTMSRYETGIIGNIPSDKIEIIASALETTPAYLMGWEEPEEDDLDNKLVQLLTKLTPEEADKVESFVQWMIANREG